MFLKAFCNRVFDFSNNHPPFPAPESHEMPRENVCKILQALNLRLDALLKLPVFSRDFFQAPSSNRDEETADHPYVTTTQALQARLMQKISRMETLLRDKGEFADGLLLKAVQEINEKDSLVRQLEEEKETLYKRVRALECHRGQAYGQITQLGSMINMQRTQQKDTAISEEALEDGRTSHGALLENSKAEYKKLVEKETVQRSYNEPKQTSNVGLREAEKTTMEQAANEKGLLLLKTPQLEKGKSLESILQGLKIELEKKTDGNARLSANCIQLERAFKQELNELRETMERERTEKELAAFEATQNEKKRQEDIQRHLNIELEWQTLENKSLSAERNEERETYQKELKELRKALKTETTKKELAGFEITPNGQKRHEDDLQSLKTELQKQIEENRKLETKRDELKKELEQRIQTLEKEANAYSVRATQENQKLKEYFIQQPDVSIHVCKKFEGIVMNQKLRNEKLQQELFSSNAKVKEMERKVAEATAYVKEETEKLKTKEAQMILKCLETNVRAKEAKEALEKLQRRNRHLMDLLQTPKKEQLLNARKIVITNSVMTNSDNHGNVQKQQKHQPLLV